MSYTVPYYAEAVPEVASPRELIFTPRSKYQWVPFLVPLALSASSAFLATEPIVTDVAFVLLTILCGVFLISELAQFPRRFGIGGLLLFGGVLIWFCHDYLSNWLGRDYRMDTMPDTAAVVARAVFWYVLFITMMVIGLSISWGRPLEKLICAIPEPGNQNFYFILMMGMFAIGVSPFFLFATEPFYIAMYRALFPSAEGGVVWTVYRTGNLNYSWGAYVAQILQVGEVGGTFACMFAVLISRRWSERIIGLAIYCFWARQAYLSGSRGETLFHILPLIAFLFLRFQAETAALFKKFSVKAYLICGGLLLFMLVLVQLQATFRVIGLEKADLTQVDLTKNQGNSMFSEAILGFRLIPASRGFFYDDYPLETLVRPIPDTVVWCVIGAIPRALWTTKPHDRLWEWYNHATTGGSGTNGTTIASGLVGNWYFNYGFWGVIEGGLLAGWMMGITERSLQQSEGRPISILMSIGVAVWLFRCYRDWNYADLYQVCIGGVALWMLVLMVRPFSSRAPQTP